jgi:hypothetical protein
MSLAEFIPIELVNHILSYRPRHPDACIIKDYKKEVLDTFKMRIDRYNNYDRFEYEREEYIIPENIDNMTFKELDPITRHYEDNIFSAVTIPNSIYQLKIQNDKDSHIFYWGKYYTEKKAMETFYNHLKQRDTYDMYYIALVNVDIDTLKETIVFSIGNNPEDEVSDDDSSCGCGRGCETSEDEEEEDDGCRCGCYCVCGIRINEGEGEDDDSLG